MALVPPRRSLTTRCGRRGRTPARGRGRWELHPRRAGLIVLLAIALSGASAARPSATDPTLVTIDSGTVRGATAGDVVGFKGIPYAAPPVGPLRWRAPRPPKPWQGVRDALRFGPSCTQPAVEDVSEDCLTVNVWRPAKPSARPLPVMVWIHGGALVRGGTALYPGDALAAQGVVVVSMNYRLGRLGFFAHPALAVEAPGDLRGNCGYMDQLAALQWVQRNIAAFGGDPRSVTIFGESAGGGSVLVHLTSPLSRGLFQRAIVQSAGVPAPRARVTPTAELDVAEKVAVDYVRSLGIDGDGAAVLEALRALPAAKLAEGATGTAAIAALSAGTLVPGMAMSIRDGRQIVDVPDVALAAGRQAMVPVIVGANDRDLPIGSADSRDELFWSFGRFAAEARPLYDPHGDQPLDELKQQVFADRTFVEPARHLADETARAGQPTWLYRFSYVAESARGRARGAQHGMEIPYTLNIPAALVGDEVTAADEAMGAIASAYWVAFAKTGDPNGGGRPLWPRHDPASSQVIDFTNAGVVVEPDPLQARLDLWQKVWTEGR
jgi:para-nitrobenzyl esterase